MRSFFYLFLVALVFLSTGCAKQPSVKVTNGTRVTFTMKVDGRIRDGSAPEDAGIPLIYMVALRASDIDNPTEIGPTPVIAPPWGNGFVSGTATHFVWFDPTAANPFTLYRFLDTDLNNYIPVGVPVNVTPLSSGGQQLQFELDMQQLIVGPAFTVPRSLQVNFLTMDRFGSTQSSHSWDALGDGRTAQINQPITIPLRTNGTYSNTLSGQIEPRGDNVNADLDLIDWSIEVRLQ